MNTCYKCLKSLSVDSEYDHTGLHKKCYCDWFELKAHEPFSSFQKREMSKDPFLDNIASWNTSFFHGAFKKYSAKLGSHSYTLKVKEDRVPELPDVEYVCNNIARTLNLHVPDFYLMNVFGVRSFVTKNFIYEQATPTNLIHIYHFLKENDSYSCETLINIILKETNNFLESEKFVYCVRFQSHWHKNLTPVPFNLAQAIN